MASAYLTDDGPDVVGLYRHNGTTLVDAKGGEAFTKTGTVTTPPCSLTPGVVAADCSALGRFDADGDVHGYASHLALTVEAVVKLDALNGTPIIAYCGEDITSALAADNTAWRLGCKVTTGVLQYQHEHTAGTDVDVDGAVALELGVWHHVAFTRNAAATEVAVYVDGVLSGSDTGLTAPDGGLMVQGTSAVGSGANGVVTTTPAASVAEGATSNDLSVSVNAAIVSKRGGTIDRPLSVEFDGTTLTVNLAVTASALVAASNTATLVAAAITAVDGFSAAASGTGATALTATETVAVTSGTSPGLAIGAPAGSDSFDFDGAIRDLRVTRRERTAAEILAAAQAALGR